MTGPAALFESFVMAELGRILRRGGLAADRRYWAVSRLGAHRSIYHSEIRAALFFLMPWNDFPQMLGCIFWFKMMIPCEVSSFFTMPEDLQRVCLPDPLAQFYN